MIETALAGLLVLFLIFGAPAIDGTAAALRRRRRARNAADRFEIAVRALRTRQETP